MEGGNGTKKECSSKASSDDHGSSDQSADDASSRRFYECIFCKRGFSTAQALGGHMNIHRKDRVKMSRQVPPASKRSVDHDESEGRHGSYCNQFHSSYPPVSESLKNYSMFLPATADIPSRQTGDAVGSMIRPREMSLFRDDHLGLGLRVQREGWGPVLGREEGGEVDLELRLGP